jgi:hypothetical protein
LGQQVLQVGISTMSLILNKNDKPSLLNICETANLDIKSTVLLNEIVMISPRLQCKFSRCLSASRLVLDTEMKKCEPRAEKFNKIEISC